VFPLKPACQYPFHPKFPSCYANSGSEEVQTRVATQHTVWRNIEGMVGLAGILAGGEWLGKTVLAPVSIKMSGSVPGFIIPVRNSQFQKFLKTERGFTST